MEILSRRCLFLPVASTGRTRPFRTFQQSRTNWPHIVCPYLLRYKQLLSFLTAIVFPAKVASGEDKGLMTGRNSLSRDTPTRDAGPEELPLYVSETSCPVFGKTRKGNVLETKSTTSYMGHPLPVLHKDASNCPFR